MLMTLATAMKSWPFERRPANRRRRSAPAGHVIFGAVAPCRRGKRGFPMKPGLPRTVGILQREDLFDRPLEQPRNSEGERQARIVFLGLDRVDRLARDLKPL